MADETARLKTVPLFEGLSRRELKSVANRLTERWFNSGETIVEEGSRGGPFFLIIEGRAKVKIGSRTRFTLGPGEFFGEISVIDGGPRSASIVADTRLRVLSLPSFGFAAVLEEFPSVGTKILTVLCQRVRDLDKSLTV